MMITIALGGGGHGPHDVLWSDGTTMTWSDGSPMTFVSA